MNIIPLFRPSISSKAIKDVAEIIKSGQIAFSQGGPRVREFEEKFAQYIGCRYAVAVNSGTAALYLALQGVPNGEVIVPSLTFVATAHAVTACGSRPVFVDVEEDTLNIDVEDLKAKITPETTGVIPVHFGGRSCNNQEILKIAAEHNLWVIDDCSHAHGSTYDGKKIGSFFDRSCFSLHPVKPVCSLGGGIITFNGGNTLLKERLETLRFCGVDARTHKGPMYNVESLGWNYYMTEPSAAVALDSLNRLDAEAKMRRKIAELYCKSLEGIKGVETLPYDPRSTYHLFILKIKHRDRFIKYMREQGVEIGIHYARGCHQYSYYHMIQGQKTKLPVTEKIVEQLVSIPIYPSLTLNEAEHIIKQLRYFISGLGSVG